MKKAPSNSQIINGLTFGFSAAFLIAALLAASYTGEGVSILSDWYRIMISPCPLVTDYFEIGSLGSAFLNASACGFSCWLFMVLLKGDSTANTLAGFFLVVTHCFYGLNFLNMWPCFLVPFVYFRRRGLNYKANLHICMFTTTFAPFISEFLFRYKLKDAFVFGEVHLTLSGVLLALLFTGVLGFVVPAILPAQKRGIKGTACLTAALPSAFSDFWSTILCTKPWGLSHPACILAGLRLGGNGPSGLRLLIRDTGYSSDFSENTGWPPA